MKVLALLAEGFEDLEAIGTIALLRRGGISVDVCSVNNSDFIIGKYQVKISSDCKINTVNYEDYDCIFLPGGMPGVDNLYASSKVKEIIKFYSKNKIIAAICAAPSILGKLNLLEGKKFTCYPGFEDECVGGTYVDKQVVIDNNIITAKAAGSIYYLAESIINLLQGNENGKKVLESIYFNSTISYH